MPPEKTTAMPTYTLAAVVVDTETTGPAGMVIELAVVDAFHGSVLLDTLVNPAGAAMEPGARTVHGLDEEMNPYGQR